MAARTDSEGSSPTIGPDEVQITAEGKHFTCSRSKLMAASTYFLAMFNSDMIESRSSEIHLKEVDSSMLKILMDYAESDQEQLPLKSHNALDLLQCASMLQFDAAMQEIKGYLLRKITSQNCCKVMIVSDASGHNGLYNKAKTMALWYFDEIIDLDDMLEFQYPMFQDYISSHSLNTKLEWNVFRSLENWINHDATERQVYLLDLLSCIHWEAISESTLECILDSTVFYNDSKSKKYIQNEWLLHKGSKCESWNRYPVETMIVVGGEWVKDPDNVFNPYLLAYDPAENSPHIVATLPEDYSAIWGHKACVIGKDLYLVGGEKKLTSVRKDWYNSVWHYDSLDGSWRVATELRTPRRHHSVVVYGQYIYVIGGFGRHRIIQSTVDRYDTINDTWESQPDLEKPVYSAAACYCNGNIYVISNYMEVLSPGASAWQQKPALPQGINWALPHDSSIYMAGMYAYSLYVFDTLAEQLTDLGLFTHCYMGRACMISNKIYVSGGEDSKMIESYDLDDETFSVENNMEHQLLNHCVVVLPKYPKFR